MRRRPLLALVLLVVSAAAAIVPARSEAEVDDAAPELLAGDGIHATETGHTRRAAAVARAVRGCPSA
jgi:hypothetical protein